MQPLVIDTEQVSVWSSEQVGASQRDAQNPQGEEELKDDLQIMLQNSAQRQASDLLDLELQHMNEGGVAAINRQQAQQRIEREEQMKAMQAEIEARAAERDNILNMRGMVPQRKPEE